MSIIIAVLAFGLIVLSHEFGHFIAAVKSGILVEEFSIGMGPRLWSYKKGDTLFSLKLFPIGGSCRMLGEDTSEGESDDRAFNNKPVWKRIIVITAGVIMNIVLALLITTFIVFVNGFAQPKIESVMPDYPAEEAGLQKGDVIKKINKTKVNIYDDLAFALERVDGTAMNVVVERDGERFDLELTPKLYEDYDGIERYKIGFTPTRYSPLIGSAIEGYDRAGFFDSLEVGFFRNIFFVKQTFVAVYELVTAKIGLDQMAGPIGVVDMIDETYTEAVETDGHWYAIQNMLSFTALLSINLAVINILPLPALDGGRLVFLIIEGIRRKPVKPETEGVIHFVGFVLLMILAVVVAFNDVFRLL